MMPAMSGKELRDRLAEVKPGFKCIFISGYTADVIGHYGVLDEGIHFLEKPFSVNSLAEKVREVLDASSVERGCICKEGVEH
jgi:FixJ family two-component response regulator